MISTFFIIEFKSEFLRRYAEAAADQAVYFLECLVFCFVDLSHLFAISARKLLADLHIVQIVLEIFPVKPAEVCRYGKLLSGVMSRISTCPGWSWDGWMMDEKRSGLTPYDLHIHDLDFMVYAFGMPEVKYQYRSKLPDQDFISLSYDFGEFSINSEASWYSTCYPFTAEFRFQFEDALVSNENGKMMIYLRNDEKIDLSQPAWITD